MYTKNYQRPKNISPRTQTHHLMAKLGESNILSRSNKYHKNIPKIATLNMNIKLLCSYLMLLQRFYFHEHESPVMHVTNHVNNLYVLKY